MDARIQGLSLMEMLLALAIMSFLLVMGIRLNNMLNKEKDIRILTENATVLLSAAADYYYANCNPANVGGSPFPNQAPDVKAVSVQNDLRLSSALMSSGYIDTSTYVVQFQPVFQDRMVTLDSSQSYKIGTNATWKIQVAVQLRLDRSNPDQAGEVDRLFKLSRATCFSKVKGSQSGNTVVEDCAALYGSQTDTGLNYLVWEKMPRQVRQLSGSPFSWFMDTVAGFTQWSTSYDRMVLVNNPGLSDQQYYTCQS